jgi:hypothetical protein
METNRIVGIHAPLTFLKNHPRRNQNVIFSLSLCLFFMSSFYLLGLSPLSRMCVHGVSWEPIRNHFTIRKVDLKLPTISLFNRKNRTNAVCVPSHFQRPAISVLTCTFTADRGLSNVKFAREASANRRISRTISSFTQVRFVRKTF